jgi:hypothetical protein
VTGLVEADQDPLETILAAVVGWGIPHVEDEGDPPEPSNIIDPYLSPPEFGKAFIKQSPLATPSS